MTNFDSCKVAITGASGSLGRALLQALAQQGASLVALTSSREPLLLQDSAGTAIPLEQVCWQCGQEPELRQLLERVDILVLNHGINQQQLRSASAMSLALEVNALSSWRLLELFAEVVQQNPRPQRPKPEVWINTSEAEIQPALSPLYELSKRLLGSLVSLRSLDLAGARGPLRIRRLVLGPFRSRLNPIGVMGPKFVANQVIAQARLGIGLIIVTPNPLTYVLMPLNTLARWGYFKLMTRPSPGQL
ncbi:MAG: SDR family NAD(P)-dependent oxidoreductase [Cyanobacteria bacterium]|nr:SDR family NAD(P)-dependent oxidoreductase [Cyanobacteriota bacterium]